MSFICQSCQQPVKAGCPAKRVVIETRLSPRHSGEEIAREVLVCSEVSFVDGVLTPPPEKCPCQKPKW
jgi:hypothetical protein